MDKEITRLEPVLERLRRRFDRLYRLSVDPDLELERPVGTAKRPPSRGGAAGREVDAGVSRAERANLTAG